MCGIAGYVGDFLGELGTRMNGAQAHRGPDGSGVFEEVEGEVMLAHVRLAILDLSEAAAQPMHSADGRFVLVFNGEIYNFQELRGRLEASGPFRSQSDTEVLLRGLALEGEGFVHKLNGMFAFALWDRRERELLLARDPLGIKPLYYAEPVAGTLLFASEIKALCVHPLLKREPDFFALQQHLAFCHATGERTAFQGVRRLLPGHLLRWRARERVARVERYWRPVFSQPAPGRFADAVGQLRAKIREATVRQLVADVPVGGYFSGGLDSSMVTQAAVTHQGRGFRCYLISYPPSENGLDGFVDDSPYAHDYAAQLGVRLLDLTIKPEVASLWPRLVYHLDEPIADPAAIACYLISKQARTDGTPVLLSGQGGDELMGGYPRYWAIQASRWFQLLPGFFRRGLARWSQHLLPGSQAGPLGVRLRRVRRVLRAADLSADDRFLAYCSATPGQEIGSVLSAEVRAVLGAEDAHEEDRRHLDLMGLEGMDRYLERDLSVYLPNHNLLYTDKMGMAVGLEARVPLLDQELVEMVTRWPANWKVARGRTKVGLREAARGVVPDSIIDRPKGGFGAPYRKWLRHDLAEMWNDLTAEPLVRRRGWFDPAALQAARERSQHGQADLYMLQWAVLTIELWARQFMDRSPASVIRTEALA